MLFGVSLEQHQDRPDTAPQTHLVEYTRDQQKAGKVKLTLSAHCEMQLSMYRVMLTFAAPRRYTDQVKVGMYFTYLIIPYLSADYLVRS